MTNTGCSEPFRLYTRAQNNNAFLELRRLKLGIDISTCYIKLPGLMQYVWSTISLRSTEKNETILILISLKHYFSHPEKSILNLSKEAL